MNTLGFDNIPVVEMNHVMLHIAIVIFDISIYIARQNSMPIYTSFEGDLKSSPTLTYIQFSRLRSTSAQVLPGCAAQAMICSLP